MTRPHEEDRMDGMRHTHGPQRVAAAGAAEKPTAAGEPDGCVPQSCWLASSWRTGVSDAGLVLVSCWGWRSDARDLGRGPGRPRPGPVGRGNVASRWRGWMPGRGGRPRWTRRRRVPAGGGDEGELDLGGAGRQGG